jgi:hypothetical protein
VACAYPSPIRLGSSSKIEAASFKAQPRLLRTAPSLTEPLPAIDSGTLLLFLAKGLDALLQNLEGLFWSLSARDLELLSALLVVGNEERLDLREDGLVRIPNCSNVLVII